MREMKDSGVAWIGEIPKDWKISKIKNISVSLKSGGTPDSSKDEFYVDKEVGIPWVAIADMSDKPYITYTQKYITEEARKSKNLTIFEAGTILYAMYASVGKVSVLGVKATINQALLAISLKKGIDDAYCTFALNAWEPYIISESNGTTQFNLNANKVANLQIPMPPENRQRIISDCINGNCVKVDSLIANVQAQIEKLKAYKQSLITEVVTKGLDPNAPMKDSGVEWIGKIPAHWSILRFKNIADIKSNLVNPKDYMDYFQVSPENIEKGSGKLLTCITVREIGVESNNHLFHKGQIIYSKVRPLLNKVAIAPFDGLCSADMYPVEAKINKKFLVYSMLSDSFLNQVKLVTENRVKMPKINQEELSKIKVCCPEDSEQKRIADYLDAKCSQIDRLISLKESKIEKLQQYKRSLIYEYVTGKKEVV